MQILNHWTTGEVQAFSLYIFFFFPVWFTDFPMILQGLLRGLLFGFYLILGPFLWPARYKLFQW